MRSLTLCAFVLGAAALQSPAMAAKHLQFIGIDDTKITHITPKGDAPGDVMTFTGVLKDMQEKKQVGTEQGFCLSIDPATKAWECVTTVVLPEGRISYTGSYFDVGDSEFAITGGTGAYKGAKGIMHLHLRGTNPETDIYTFDLE
jgi:allene oxide cyclase